jgi:hypothetical protein
MFLITPLPARHTARDGTAAPAPAAECAAPVDGRRGAGLRRPGGRTSETKPEQGGCPVSLAPNTRWPPVLLCNTALRRSRRRSCGRGGIDAGDIARMFCRGCPTCNGRLHCPSASRRGRFLVGRDGNLRSSSHRQDGIWDALDMAAEALPNRARRTADLPWVTVQERQQDAVGLVNR